MGNDGGVCKEGRGRMNVKTASLKPGKNWHISSASLEFLFSRTDTTTQQPMQVKTQRRERKEQ